MFQPVRQTNSAAAATMDAAPSLGLGPLAAIDFGRIWSVIWQGKGTIFLTMIAALVATLVFIALAPRQYTAVTEILIDPSDLRAVENNLAPANQMNDAAVLQVESQVRVLTSDNVLRRVIKSAELDHDPEFVGALSPLRALANGFLARFGLNAAASTADPILSALNELQRHIRVKRAERTYVVDVAVTSKEPEKAARIANVIAQSYLAEQTQARSDTARRVSDSISARLSELKDRVREAEDRSEAFKGKNNIVGASGQLVNEQQLHELSNQLSAAHARTAEAKARYDQVESLRSKPEAGAFAEAVQSQTITALRTQYAEVMRREAEQMTTLGARHPSVIEVHAQAERLRRLIGEEINRLALSARNDYEGARANEDALNRSFEALKRNTLTTNEALVTLRELDRDVQASRAVYESFLVRARETGEQEQLDTRNISVISKADAPLRRSWPPSGLVLALASLMFGAAAGTGIVLIRGSRDGASLIHDGNVAEGIRHGQGRVGNFPEGNADIPFDLPVIAVLPSMDEERDLDSGSAARSNFAAGMRRVYEAVRVAPKKGTGPSVLVVALDSDRDVVAVSLNLAWSMAGTQRVLLVDADLRGRTISKLMPDQNQGGLVDVAVGRKVLSDVVVHDRMTNINVLPLISSDSRRRSRIDEQGLKSAFDQTRRFDMVIVAAIDWDRDPSARFFAGLVDHIVFVSTVEKADKGGLDPVLVTLNGDAHKVRGIVLTGANAA